MMYLLHMNKSIFNKFAQMNAEENGSNTNLSIINILNTLVIQKLSKIFSLYKELSCFCFNWFSFLQNVICANGRSALSPGALRGTKHSVHCIQSLAEQLTLTGVLVFSTFSFPSLELFFVEVERSLSLLSLMWSRSFSLFLSFLFRLWWKYRSYLSRI